MTRLKCYVFSSQVTSALTCAMNAFL